MFNAFTHEKQLTQSGLTESADTKYLKMIPARSKLREKLAKMNKIRMKDRLLQMSADPVPISRKNYSIQLPDFKGETFFRHQAKDSKERVKAAEVSNNWLDTVPILPPPHDFRPRIKSKEIHSNMKFTPKDRYERVADTWELQKSILDSSWKVNSQQSSDKFPNTLRKSYYKTVESLAMNIGAPGKSIRLPSVNKSSVNDQGLDMRTERTLAEVAQDLMEKCKLKPLKGEINTPYQSRSPSLPLKIIIN